jgi:hypothetical protein
MEISTFILGAFTGITLFLLWGAWLIVNDKQDEYKENKRKIEAARNEKRNKKKD